MKVPAYSLRILFLVVTLMAGSLAALLHPTDSVAFGLGLIMSVAMLAAVAFAFGADTSTRASYMALVVCTLLILYQNDEKRQVLTSLPAFNRVAADWINERFGWAEPKGSPNTWVYWSRGNRVYYEAFDANGRRRSVGRMSRGQAERLRIKVDLDNLPEWPPTHASEAALGRIVALVAALYGGLFAALLAQAASKRSLRNARNTVERGDP